MKKSFLLFASAVLLLAGCQKSENISQSQINGGDGEYTFSLSVPDASTKAVKDGDGAAVNVDHWVMEVLDADGERYNYQEEDGATGTLTHSFTVRMVKGQKYTVLFWADTKGTYDVSKLEDVKLADESSYDANLDSRDAFSAVVDDFQTTQATSRTVTLKRAVSQMNIIFTDLEDLFKTMGSDPDEYGKFKPVNFKAEAKIPTTFNVKTQKAGAPATTALNITADGDYLDNYDKHSDKETLFMDYFFSSAGEKDLVDIDFSFTSKGVAIEHSFTSIPFQRNYRTNIIGEFMSSNATWNVTVDPDWATSDNDQEYFDFESITVNSLAEANTAFAKANGDSYALGYFAVTIKGDINTATDGTQLILPKTESYYKDKKVIVNFLGNITGSLEVAYADATTQDAQPTILDVYAAKADNLWGNLTKTTVTLQTGDYTTTTWKTAPTTFKKGPDVHIGKLIIEQGGIFISAENLDEIVIAEGATQDGNPSTMENRIQIKVAEDAVIKKLVLNAPAVVDLTEAKSQSIVECQVNHNTDVKTAITDEKEDKSLVTKPQSAPGCNDNYNELESSVVACIGSTDYDDLEKAVKAAQSGDVIKVMADSVEIPAISKSDVTLTSSKSTKVTKFTFGDSPSNITFDGFEFTDTFNPHIQNMTVKNCKFTGKNGIRWAYGYGLIENCVFDTDVYGIHFDEIHGALTVKNCTLVGFTTLASCSTPVVFDNCKFVDSSKNPYYVAQSWGSVKFESCSFSKKWCEVNDNQTIGIASGTGTAELNNCTVETGTVIAACKNSATTGLVAVDVKKDGEGKYTAGSFFGDVSSVKDNIVSWLTLKENGDGTWTIAPDPNAYIVEEEVKTMVVPEGTTIIINSDELTAARMKKNTWMSEEEARDAFFMNNTTESVTLPASINDIASGMFYNALKLKEIVMDGKGSLKFENYPIINSYYIETITINNLPETCEFNGVNDNSKPNTNFINIDTPKQSDGPIKVYLPAGWVDKGFQYKFSSTNNATDVYTYEDGKLLGYCHADKWYVVEEVNKDGIASIVTCGTEKVAIVYPNAKTIIPAGITDIQTEDGEWPFASNKVVENVWFPSSLLVNKDGKQEFNGTFTHCDALEDFTLEGGNDILITFPIFAWSEDVKSIKIEKLPTSFSFKYGPNDNSGVNPRLLYSEAGMPGATVKVYLPNGWKNAGFQYKFGSQIDSNIPTIEVYEADAQGVYQYLGKTVNNSWVDPQ